MANPQYYGTIPQIAQAFQNDPRTRLSQSALALGSSTAPVAQGGWAVTDGLARAAQAVAGALINKNQEKKYAAREAKYGADLNAAAQLASTPQGSPAAAVNPAMLNPSNVNPGASPDLTKAVQALAGGSAPQFAPSGPAEMPPAQSPASVLQNGMAGLQPPGPLSVSGGPPAANFAPSAGGPSSLDLYRAGIRPIEGGTDPRTGAFRTSPKGAVGPGQIMPGTGPEAARLAGLAWDPVRFKSDTAYNDALGAAYYDKQLRTFGDPVVAAAAYNAGPGRVRRALRQSRTSGQDFTAHLPSETQGYVQKFTQAVSGQGLGKFFQQGDTPQNVPSPAIQTPQMEAVPQGPAAPGARPDAPQLPPEVQSNRIAMAQQLISTGNPDLMAIAQQYLDKGLDEQFNARQTANQQQFQQGQTGYGADLSNWQNASSDARQDQYGQRRDAQQRNFSRENNYNNQQFQAMQAQTARQFEAQQAAINRRYGTSEREATQNFQAQQNDLNRSNRTDIAQLRAQQRNAYFTSPAGLAAQAKNQKEFNDNDLAISKYRRFLELNANENTGGIGQNAPVVGGMLNFMDGGLSEMDKIAKDTTLANLGGGLGAQISDSDRKFIEGANIGVQNKRSVNENIANARIAALQRRNDYLTEFQNAQADGTQAQFPRMWAQYAKEVPIVRYSKDGKRVEGINTPMTFSEWQASRPTFDKNGKRVN